MTRDAHKNFAVTLVTVAPSPATSGTSLEIADPSYMPAVPFNAVIHPAGVQPTNLNAEIVRVTNIAGTVVTITRENEPTGSGPRTVLVGDVFADAITARVLTDAEDPIGYVFITAVTGAGTVSSKAYEANTIPANKVLDSFTSDNNDITLTVEIHAAINAWQPASVSVAGAGITPVTSLRQTWSQPTANVRVWTATLHITDAATTGTLTVTLDGGDTDTVAYTRQLDPPLVLTAVWDNQGTNADPYPAVQTQFKNNDVMQLSGTAESHATHVYIKDFEATSGQGLQGPYTVTAGVWTAANVKAGNAANAAAHYKVYAVNGIGNTPGADFSTSTTTDHSQTVPTFGAASIAYPATQEAIKDAETADVTLAQTNIHAGDTYVYSSAELTIPSTTTYASPKTGVSRGSATYRESGTNFTLTVTRTTMNGASAASTTTVRVAHNTPVITVGGTSGGAQIGRLGSGAGTLDTTVYLISDMVAHSTYASTSLAVGSGDTSAWQGSWSRNAGGLYYTRSKRVVDADIAAGGQSPNNFTWGAVSVKNRANREATVVTTHTTYQLGGFTTRTLTVGAWPNREASFGPFAVDTSKLVCENLSKGGAGPNGGTIFAFSNAPGEGSTPTDALNKFAVSDGAAVVDSDSNYFYNCDQPNASSNTSGTAQVLMQETA